MKKEVFRYENDISAKEKTEEQGAWFQSQDEHTGRKKGISVQTCQGKKEIICIVYGSQYVTFFSMRGACKEISSFNVRAKCSPFLGRGSI